MGVELSPARRFLEQLAGDLKSDLLKGILKAFKASGIEIPYPHREVRLITTVATNEIPSAPTA